MPTMFSSRIVHDSRRLLADKNRWDHRLLFRRHRENLGRQLDAGVPWSLKRLRLSGMRSKTEFTADAIAEDLGGFGVTMQLCRNCVGLGVFGIMAAIGFFANF
jgi:hypothetical protein